MKLFIGLMILISLTFTIVKCSATASDEIEEVYNSECEEIKQGCAPPYLNCELTSDGSKKCVRKGLFPLVGNKHNDFFNSYLFVQNIRIL